MVTAFEERNSAFAGIVGNNPTIETLAVGFRFTEGPVWRGDHLLFTDFPQNRIVKYQMMSYGPEITTFRSPSGAANGTTLDREGRYITCEHANRRVARTGLRGRITVLATHYQGKRLNSPNDVVVKSNGGIYFTDPPFGLPNQREGKELDFQGVYRVSADGKTLTLLVSDMERPNGLAFTPDERRLYINDSTRYHIRVFDVKGDGTLAGGSVFAELRPDAPGVQGVPDGMKVDTQGNVYCTGPLGIWIFDSRGTFLGRIVPPQVPANIAWGDDDWKSLYVTARTGLYRVRLNIPGIRVGK